MTNEKLPTDNFSVDTHLFRELGQLLVGRESTALIELVKNAYDADATEVTIFGAHLGDPRRGVIRISDNGVGMDPETFRRGFLRIAARIKNEGIRKSALFARRFTGAKGIGRLSAHKLAKKVEVISIPKTSKKDAVGVQGTIDWDKVEAFETLDDIRGDAVVLKNLPFTKRDAHGTSLTLTRLRQKWTKLQLGRFLLEVEALRAPEALVAKLPASVAPEPGLFEVPYFVDAKSNDPGFNLALEGDFQAGDNYWPTVLEAANWLLEIDVASSGIRYLVTPTKRTQKALPNAKRQRFVEKHPDPKSGLFFHARILIRKGQPTGKKTERAWASRLAGVRVYMEGFRVLPYGEESDDWLSLTRDTTDRNRKLRFLADSPIPGKLTEIEDEGLHLLPNKHYFGGVFLTTDRSGSLQMLVNREGFVPDASFELLVTLVRRGIDLSTRVRLAAEATAPLDPIEASPLLGDNNPVRPSAKSKAEYSIQNLTNQATELRKIAEAAPEEVKTNILDAAIEIERAASIYKDTIPANSMVLVLASVGTQLAAFIHEVNRLLALATDVENTITRLRDQETPSNLRSRVSKVAAAAADLRRALERQAAYLIDIVTPDARRRRSRIKIHDSVNATWKLLATTAEQHGVSLHNNVDTEIRTPPMFRSELMAVFTNLLTNAVKAAGERGSIKTTASRHDDGFLRIRIENTGIAVDPADGEHWFEPFTSTTVSIDPVLGQGMGLGLVITRDLLAEVGASVHFVRPRRGYATAVEIVFPGEAQ